MAERSFTLTVLPGTFSVCRLNAEEAIPDWALRSAFFSITRAAEELSIVCPQVDIPMGTRCERDWRCLRIEGPFDFTQVGVLESVLQPLAEAGVSIFASSTYDTDYVMVKQRDLERALAALGNSGHSLQP